MRARFRTPAPRLARADVAAGAGLAVLPVLKAATPMLQALLGLQADLPVAVPVVVAASTIAFLSARKVISVLAVVAKALGSCPVPVGPSTSFHRPTWRVHPARAPAIITPRTAEIGCGRAKAVRPRARISVPRESTPNGSGLGPSRFTMRANYCGIRQKVKSRMTQRQING